MIAYFFSFDMHSSTISYCQDIFPINYFFLLSPLLPPESSRNSVICCCLNESAIQFFSCWQYSVLYPSLFLLEVLSKILIVPKRQYVYHGIYSVLSCWHTKHPFKIFHPDLSIYIYYFLVVISNRFSEFWL